MTKQEYIERITDTINDVERAVEYVSNHKNIHVDSKRITLDLYASLMRSLAIVVASLPNEEQKDND